MIRFKEDTCLTVINEFANGNIGSDIEQTFDAGETVDASICNVYGDYVDIEFGDGRKALGVLRDCFEVVQ